MERIAELKLLLDIPQKEEDRDMILLELLAQAEKYALAYCRLSEADEFLSSIIVRMAAEDYGALGGEGITKRSLSGLTEDYRGAYSAPLISALRSRRKPGVPQ